MSSSYKILLDIFYFIDKYYLFFVLFNLFIICLLLLIILIVFPYIPFDGTPLLKIFGGGNLLESTYFGVLVTSISLIPDLIFDIYRFYRGKQIKLSRIVLRNTANNTNKKWNHIIRFLRDDDFHKIVVKILLILGQGLPALLLILFLKHDRLQCVVYCATTYMQNVFWACNLLILYVLSLKERERKYFGVAIVILLFFYELSSFLYTLQDFYFPKGTNLTLDTIAIISSISQYIVVFYALYQTVKNFLNKILGYHVPFSNERKFELILISIIIIKQVADSFYNVKDDRHEDQQHMIIINLMGLYYLIIIYSIYTHDKLDNLESDNDTLRVLSEQLLREKSAYEKFVFNMVPPKIATKISEGIPVMPEHFKYVCIFNAQIHGIEEYIASSSPMKAFSLSNQIFSVMDKCVNCFSTLCKVQLQSNAYVVVSGLNCNTAPFTDDSEYDDSRGDLMADIVEFALLVNEATQLLEMDGLNKNVSLRIGLHCGEVVSGLIGTSTPRYSLIGNTVNTANYLQESCNKNKIQVSEDFVKNLQSYSTYDMNLSSLYTLQKREHNVEEAALLNSMETYWLEKSSNVKLNEKFKNIFNKTSGASKSTSFDLNCKKIPRRGNRLSYSEISVDSKQVTADTRSESLFDSIV